LSVRLEKDLVATLFLISCGPRFSPAKRGIIIATRLNIIMDLPVTTVLSLEHGNFTAMLEIAENVMPQLVTIFFKDRNINL
jgi:hypothetical protein